MDSVHWAYPRSESAAQLGAYIVGDSSEDAKLSWCLASAYLFALPLGDSFIEKLPVARFLIVFHR
jgi:hypothetical protein